MRRGVLEPKWDEQGNFNEGVTPALHRILKEVAEHFGFIDLQDPEDSATEFAHAQIRHRKSGGSREAWQAELRRRLAAT